jgi:hypothetical protein
MSSNINLVRRGCLVVHSDARSALGVPVQTKASVLGAQIAEVFGRRKRTPKLFSASHETRDDTFGHSVNSSGNRSHKR